jgi:hypothetical protein
MIDQVDPNAPAPPSATSAEPVTDTPAPIDINEDINLEMSHDEIHSTLRDEWKESYDDRFAAASRVVGEIFHNDDTLLNWFAERLGNHVNVIRIADRLSAMLDGHRPARVATTPPAQDADVDAELEQFKPGGKHYDAWLGGDKRLNDRRIELYTRKDAGQTVDIISDNFGIR